MVSVLSWWKRSKKGPVEVGKPIEVIQVMSLEEVEAVLEARSQELLGIDATHAIKLAEAGELPDDIPGHIVGSWVLMAKGAQMAE